MAKGGRVQLCSNCIQKKKGGRVIVEKSRRGISRRKGDEEDEEIRAESSKKGYGYRKEKGSRSPVKRTRKNTKSKVSRRKKSTVPKNKKENKPRMKRGRGRKTNSPKEPATKRRRRSGQIKLHINQTEILKPHIEPIKCYQAPSKERNLKAKIDRPVTILAFDLETTGFNTPAERIVEFAARNLIGGRDSTFQTLIDPQKIIKNSDIHGITNSMIKKDGAPRMEDVIPRLFEWVERQEPDKPVIWLAHNGKGFDFPFLIREMNRCGFDVPDRWRFFDTLTLARRLVDYNGLALKKHKVTDLCEFFSIVVEEAAHTAMGQVPQVVNRRGRGARGGRRGRGARQPPTGTRPDRVYTGSFHGGYTGFNPYAWSRDQFLWWG